MGFAALLVDGHIFGGLVDPPLGGAELPLPYLFEGRQHGTEVGGGEVVGEQEHEGRFGGVAAVDDSVGELVVKPDP